MLSKFSVKKPLTVIVGVILTIILGIVSYTNMTTDLLPSIDLPMVAVITTYPGASPEKVELAVTKPLEQALSTTSGIEKIDSISNENSSMIMLQFTQGTNMDSTMLDISGKVDMVKPMLDDDVGAPMLMKINPDMLPIVIASVDMDGMDIKEVSKYVEKEIIPEFERVNGVASVSTTGLVEESIQISLNEEKIDELNQKLLNSIDKNLAETKSQLDTAETQLKEARIKLSVESSNQTGKLQQTEMTLNTTIAVMETSLDTLKGSIQELEAKKTEVISEMEELKKVIEEKGEGPETAKEQLRLKELETYLKLYEGSINEIKIQTEELSKKLVEAKAGLKKVQEGKALMTEELAKAEIQLNDSEYALKKGQEEFDNASEVAYKEAGLSGMLSKESLSQILIAENFSMPAGYVSEDGEQYLVKVGEEFSSVEELENLELMSLDMADIGTIKLKDIATVAFIDNSEDMYAKINGNDGVLLSFQKQSTSSTAEVSKSINEAMKKLMENNEGLHITTLNDQGVYIDIIVGSVLNNLILGGILAVIILYIFLRDLKPTIIVALSIPISLLFALALMYFSGVTMNIISLSGLALGVGMLVDNSIVVIENIYRLKGEGMSAARAAVQGAKQVAGAIAASTLTTICVFLPIVFTKGISRQLFVDMGLTIGYSLIASLIIALTLIPTMSSMMLKKINDKPHKFFDKFVRLYEKLLRKTLAHKAFVLIGVIALLIFSAISAFSMGTAFMPESDSSQISVAMEMPKGSTTKEARDMSNKVIEQLTGIEEIETIGAMQSSGTMGLMGGGSNNNISLYIILKDERSKTSQEIAREIETATKDLPCEISVQSSNMDMSALGGSGISVLVKGKELEQLQTIAKDVAGILKETPGTTEVSDGLEETSRETRIIVDKNKALKYGLTVAQVYQEVSKVIASEAKSTTLNIASTDYPVIIMDAANNITRENLKDKEITVSSKGKEEKVKLGEIAEINEGESLASIRHDNQTRCITVSAGIDSEHNIGLVSRDFEKNLEKYEVPEGYDIEITGENETIRDTLWDLIKMIALAIAFIYLIMVAQFQSFLSPFIVLFTIPLAFTGGLLALLLTGFEISMISMLGFLVLSGVVVNNGIVFVDYANQLRLEGMEKREALIETGKARIRPILMTALTTILGLSTLAMGMGMGADMVQPMAIVTIGGLSYATVLTLFVVPAIYDLLHRKPLKSVDIDEEEI